MRAWCAAATSFTRNTSPRPCSAHGGVFYDIGVNIGVLSVLAAKQAEVFAFETEENNLIYLRSNLPNERVFGVAVGAADGQATFDRRGGAFSGHLISERENAGRRGVTVTVRSVDSLARDLPPPTLIKIDVEGGEGAVLDGAVETLRAHRPIVICELHAFSDGPQSARRVLEAAGYQIRPLGGKHIIAGLDLA
jgi:FkbM family methyltransferase